MVDVEDVAADAEDSEGGQGVLRRRSDLFDRGLVYIEDGAEWWAIS